MADPERHATADALEAFMELMCSLVVEAVDEGGIMVTIPPTPNDDHAVSYRIAGNGDVHQLVASAHYLSTACLHELHDRCRLSCKWCDEQCRCPCHSKGDP